ncbi:hypothetical protein E1263_33300 [Kribbella antibiotica]|uniref:Uncharacterized protein n=1 Tax=Kribbella antibiotica TaxID=190195 RepID=A0A4V2YLY3_9ACTN|nr:hypothetical protein [Kribbella antibiotica]TDD48477.1 hypothetical protein E1263_33300 [Kribbella antibiotica]
MTLLCLLTGHRAAEWSFLSDADKCRQVQRCRRCDGVVKAETLHSWGEPQRTAGRGACAANFSCQECGEQKQDFAHQFEVVWGKAGGRCTKTNRCAGCGEVAWRFEDHQYSIGNPICERCGYDSFVDEA